MKTLWMFFVLLGMAGVVHAQNFDILPELAPQEEAKDSSPKCGDDPRLMDIVSIMESDTPPSPQLTITPEAFLRLDPEVVQALGGKMMVCPDNPVLKGGKTFKKIMVNFDVVMEKLLQAAIMDDFDAVKRIASSYSIAPKLPKDVVALGSPLRLDQAVAKKFYAALGLELPHQNFQWYIGIFTALGGKATERADVYCSYSSNSRSQCPENAFFVLTSSNGESGSMARQFSLAGLNAIVL